jgi:hypothetical protein
MKYSATEKTLMPILASDFNPMATGAAWRCNLIAVQQVMCLRVQCAAAPPDC